MAVVGFHNMTGALYRGEAKPRQNELSFRDGGGEGGINSWGVNASRSNSIFSKSSTVQPPSIQVLIIIKI